LTGDSRFGYLRRTFPLIALFTQRAAWLAERFT